MPKILQRPDFRRLWLADALSQLGTRVDFLVLPLLATTTLAASVVQVSLLRTLSTLPYLLLGLQAGAWCDRMRNRPVLITADLARALLIGSVPVAALCGMLTLGHLFAVVLLTGVCTVFFNVAHQTYLPLLVERSAFAEANAALQTNMSVAAIAGPGLGGLLVQAAGNAGAIAVDALSYLWSALWLRRIRTPEAAPEAAERNLRREITEGLRTVLRQPILRSTAAYGALSSLFQSMYLAVSVVFLSRDLHLAPGVIGLLSAVSLLGALLAGVVAQRIGARFGAARALLFAAVVYGGSFPLYAFTTAGWGLTWFVAAGLGSGFGIILLNVYTTSFRQAVTPRPLLGRVTSVTQTVLFGAAPLGSLLGGAIAEAANIRVTLYVCGFGLLASTAILFATPLRRLPG
ncbi:MFS transporter [Amycolatopsis jiangsuensis]|uniref:MFS family permease n=1 Tax=Amycolatopsis jiangsuensis TaxID=1181879 RepID=A0A840IZE3_9PSEU|nr:MFS transporter [Amycolatopsis jiangsuensis]MBB4686879.1 MFS family permease [Amycolatopsis jiangsuensis]